MKIKELFAPLVWRLLVNIHGSCLGAPAENPLPMVHEESPFRCSAGIPIELGK